MNMILDLFDAPVVPGLAARNNVISQAEEAELITRIETVSLSPFRFKQWTGKRMTRSFGWHYDFEGGTFVPTEPMPDWLMPVKARGAAFAGVARGDLVQALLTRFDPEPFCGLPIVHDLRDLAPDEFGGGMVDC